MSRTQILALGHLLSQTHPIPPEIEGRILPKDNSSVAQLLAFRLPSVADHSTSNVPVSEFFSPQTTLTIEPHDLSDTTFVDLIRSLPLPAVGKLVDVGKHCTKQQNGQSTLRCPHSRLSAVRNCRLPLWVVTYWVKVYDIITTHQQPWLEAKLHLDRLGAHTDSSKCSLGLLLSDVNDVLHSLPWAGSVDTLDGRDPVHELPVYASRNWFSDVHENQMLHSLRMAIQSDDFLSDQVAIEGVFFYTHLAQAYAERDSDIYTSSHSFQRLRRLGESLANGHKSMLATIININGNHWVSVIIDFENALVMYADSMGGEPSREFLDVMGWWTNLHSGRDFRFMKLAVTAQRGRDSFSCGLLCFNALEHFFFKDRAPLIRAKDVDEGRLQILSRFARRRFCKSFPDAVKHGSDFTFECARPKPTPAIIIDSRPTTPIRNSSVDDEVANLSNSVAKLAVQRSQENSHPVGDSTLEFQDSPAHRREHHEQREDSDKRRSMLSLLSYSSSETESIPSSPSPSNDRSARGAHQQSSLYSSSYEDSGSDTDTSNSLRKGFSALFKIRKKSASRFSSEQPDDSDGDRCTSPESPTLSAASRLVKGAASKLKRKVVDLTPSSTSNSPEKKAAKIRAESATRTALRISEETGSKNGLLNFFRKCTREEYEVQCKRARAISEESYIETLDERKAMQSEKMSKRREHDRLRQLKHRKKVKGLEILNGVRSPGGTKRKQKETTLELRDDQSKRSRKELAELSRPAREVREHDRKHTKKRSKAGRKRKNVKSNVRYVNWHTPFLWSQIDQVAKHPSVGYSMSETAIVTLLRKRNPTDFAALSRSTVQGWIDRPKGKRPHWSSKVLKMVEHGQLPGGKGGRIGILNNYPNVVKAIRDKLEALRDASAPITLVTVRGIFVATIMRLAPEIFDIEYKDGSKFRCSESFIRKWLRDTLSWSVRRPTRAGHKLPEDADLLCKKALFRIAYCIKEEEIPAELFVNSDQTQMVYAPGSGMTWTKSGTKQVSVVGDDEKRAVTIVVSIANGGKLLPFQVIFKGATDRSCPHPSANCYDDCKNAGMRFEPSRTDTYWSTLDTMQLLVENIIAPYFTEQKEKLGLPMSQKCIWQIDVWSVHRSAAFRDWMKKNYPWIIVHYVPAGCTGIFQPSDVGFQRILKLSLKQSYHKDLVDDFLRQIEAGNDISINGFKLIKELRDRAVTWFFEAFKKLDDPKIIKKAFEMCKGGDFNLSYASLTSRECREALKELRKTDAHFYAELTQSDSGESAEIDESVVAPEDNVGDGGGCPDFDDDTNIPIQVFASHVQGYDKSKLMESATGDLTMRADAETAEVDEHRGRVGDVNGSDSVELGRGKRIKKASKHYPSEDFWRH